MRKSRWRYPSNLKIRCCVALGIFLGTLECTVDAFLSRPEAAKCVTPPLAADQAHLAEQWRPVTLVKSVRPLELGPYLSGNTIALHQT